MRCSSAIGADGAENQLGPTLPFSIGIFGQTSALPGLDRRFRQRFPLQGVYLGDHAL
jgi:hypothetical protein